MTRFLVALALSGSLLSAIGDVLHLLDSLRDPGPALVIGDLDASVEWGHVLVLVLILEKEVLVCPKTARSSM